MIQENWRKMLCEIQLTLSLLITKYCTRFVTLINYEGYNYLVIRNYIRQADKIKREEIFTLSCGAYRTHRLVPLSLASLTR